MRKKEKLVVITPGRAGQSSGAVTLLRQTNREGPSRNGEPRASQGKFRPNELRKLRTFAHFQRRQHLGDCALGS